MREEFQIEIGEMNFSIQRLDNLVQSLVIPEDRDSLTRHSYSTAQPIQRQQSQQKLVKIPNVVSNVVIK